MDWREQSKGRETVRGCLSGPDIQSYSKRVAMMRYH